MKKFLFALTTLLIFSSADAQKASFPWLDFQESNVLGFRNAERPIVPQKYRTVKLDKAAFENALSNVEALDYSQGKKAKTELVFPMPDGSNQLFKVYEASVMHPDLAAKYPEIKNYAGYGVDDPTAYIRFGISPSGLHAMVRSSRTGTSYIDTYSKADIEHYISYFRKDFAREDGSKFSCHVNEVNEIVKEQSLTNDAELRIGDCQIRKYRTTMTADSDYSRFHGGTIPSVLAEINRLIARLNSIFQLDISITFELVANNDLLIFLDPATDPFGSGNILGTNNTITDQRIGDANYDIGHLLTTGSGGFAGLGVVCNNASKASGTTGLPNPTGDPFWVEYVAHEIGHQFDANHSYNNSCGGQRNNSTAAEPGSGSTIMSYIGICAPNIGNEGDGRPFFHAINLEEIYDFITSPNHCAETTTTNNSIPVATADGDRILPIGTPFVLTGSATDADGDNLTYGWDQMDIEINAAPPVANASSGPVFEFIIPDETPERYIPNLPDLVRNVTPTWEVLPTVSRNMSFQFVVRDNAPGNGCVGTDDIELTFDDGAGPFLVETPNDAATWLVGETRSITWDVANTDAAPISCGEVDIFLSTDGGLTYPITLAASVPNNGSFDVEVPNEISTSARVMVKCASSYFFDISNQNFSIELPPAPTFFISVADDELSLCNTEEATFVFSFSTLLGFNEDVILEVAGVPANATANFNNSTLNPNGTTSILTISNLENVPTGVYPLTVTAFAPSETRTVDLELTIFDGAPGQPLLQSPTNGETDVFTDAALSWDATTGTDNYLLEIATSPAFGGSIISTQSLSGTTFELLDLNLDDNTIYYWRLTPTNACGDGTTSEIFAFRTLVEACAAVQSPNLPITISAPQAASYTNELQINQSVAINRVNVLLEFEHTYVGDLSAAIVSPNGTRVILFQQPGVPTIDNFGCPGDDIQVIFDDDAALSSNDFENTCNTGIAIQGIYQPVGQLSDFRDEDAQGTWTLEFSDGADQDGGALIDWQVEICQALEAGEAPNLIENNTLLVTQSTSEIVENTNLSVSSAGSTASNIQYSIRRNVTEGTLQLGGVALGVGDIFTQSDINAGNLLYQHGGGTVAADNFIFDVFNADGEWLSNQVFNIDIQFNTVAVSAAQTGQILCFGDNNGTITISGSGGTPPYTYSLNGGTFQTDNVFTQLLPGDYTATVRDVNGFARDAGIITISEPSSLVVSSAVADDVVTISVSGGTPFYEYSINGVDFQSDNIFNNVPNGAYTATVRDANGCLQTTSLVVAVNSLVASASLINDITCSGADDARIEVIVAGGNAPYTYSLNGTPVQSSNIFENIPAGNHTITVFDADGFQINTNQVLVTNPEAIAVNIEITDDVITVNANGGTGVLRYSLNGGGFQTNNIFSGLPNGDYTVSVRDDNGCTTTEMVNISVNRVTIATTLVQDNLCFEENIAVIEAIANGGNPPYQYSLNGGAFQSDNRFENLPPGNYVITTVDADGFTRASTAITVFGPPEIAIRPEVDGYNITVNASGGAPPYEYSLDGIAYSSDNVFNNNPSGDYTIFVRDANGCEQSNTALIDVLALSLTAEVSGGILCSGDETGEVSLLSNGGIAPFEYSINGTDFQSDNIFTDLPAGLYTFYIRDVGGFTNSVDITITQPRVLVLNAPTFGVGTMTFNSSGGTGGYEYSFNGSAFSADNSIAIEVDTDYEVVVRDENGCTMMGTFSVASVQLSSLEIDADCAGIDDATIEVFVAGGAMPLEYSLDGVNYQSQSSFSNLPSGDFEIFVRDAAGFVYSFAGGNIPVYPIAVTTDVMNDNQVTIIASAGVEPYTYSVDNGPFEVGNVFTDLTSGEHTFTIRDANGCEVTVSETVGSSSASDIFSQLSFEINPNQSSGNITLRMAQVTGQRLNARVFDNTGKLVFEERFEKFGLNIERNFNLNLAPGNYFITIDDGEIFGRKQLVIIK